MTDKINVLEDGKPLSYTYADMMHFHGFGYPGGVAHAFKVMQRAMPLLSPDGPPERREIVIRTAFRGPGGRDAFEMVTRGLTEGRYTVDHGLEKPERGNILERYVFELSYRGKTVTLQLKEGHVREEFIIVSRKPGRTPAEEDRLVWLKQEMADRLLLAPAEAVYEEA